MPPLAEGFALIAKYIQAAGRPLTSFCACELRSPAAFTDDGFRKFNEHYVKTFAEWGLFDGSVNPVARSNVCPEINPPAEPSFYAFSFTRPSQATMPSFVIAGSGEAREGGATYSERTVRYRDLSPDGLKEKVRFVVGAMEQPPGSSSTSAGRTPQRCRPIPCTTFTLSSPMSWSAAAPPVPA